MTGKALLIQKIANIAAMPRGAKYRWHTAA
jgi:hypothetical protein